MKTLYIFRDSYDAQFILSTLEKEGVVDYIILESGKLAKSKKLKRFFRNKPIILYPLICLDIFSLLIYSFVMISKMKKTLGEFAYPFKKISLRVDDVNEAKCLIFIKKVKPDVIIIYGTGIVKKAFLEAVHVPILNIHTGILPTYRNVHSDFWAYKNKDYTQIGTSIIYLDAGVDTGDIAVMNKLHVNDKTSLLEIKVENLKQIPSMLITVLDQIKKGKQVRVKQKDSTAEEYTSPTFFDLLSLIHR